MPFIKCIDPYSDENSSSDETVNIYTLEKLSFKSNVLSTGQSSNGDARIVPFNSNGMSTGQSSNGDARIVPFERKGNIINFLEERSANEYKLRIRNVRYALTEPTPVFIALNYFNSELGAKVLFSDIASCELVKSWANKDEQDVIVSFTKLGVRYRLYDLRTRSKHTLQKVCDELGPERIEIWKMLFRIFGEGGLYTSLGKVALCRNGKKHSFIYVSDVASYYYSPEKYKFGEYYVRNKAYNVNKM